MYHHKEFNSYRQKLRTAVIPALQSGEILSGDGISLVCITIFIWSSTTNSYTICEYFSGYGCLSCALRNNFKESILVDCLKSYRLKGVKMKTKNKKVRHILAMMVYCEWKFGHFANWVFGTQQGGTNDKKI